MRTYGQKYLRRSDEQTLSVSLPDRVLVNHEADVDCTDYSIHFFEPLNLLIAHMRYVGPPEDYESDMEKIKEDPKTREWWAVSVI